MRQSKRERHLRRNISDFYMGFVLSEYIQLYISYMVRFSLQTINSAAADVSKSRLDL